MKLTTEEKILNAARTVFTQKGFAASRMQEIADTAGINKGLLHYYFRSKEKLFTKVFDEAITKFAPRLDEIVNSDNSLHEKIEKFVHQYISMFIEHPYIPAFILNELNQNPDLFAEKMFSRKDVPNPMKLLMQVQSETEAGIIRDINPLHLVMSIVSLCAFPFIARPLLMKLANADQNTFMQLMELRKKEVTDFVFNSLRP